MRFCTKIKSMAALLALTMAAPAAAQEVLDAESEFRRVAGQAQLAFSAGRFRDALMIAREAHAFAAAELGKEHVLTLRALNDIAVIHQLQGDHQAAFPLAVAAAAGLERVAGADHQETLNALANLAQLHVERGAAADAEPLLRRVLSARERTIGAEQEATLNALLELAAFLKRQRRLGEVAARLEQGAAAARAKLGAEHVLAIDLTAAAAEARKKPPG